MSIFFGVALFLLGSVFLLMGFGSLKDSANHEEYSSGGESLHRRFSWLFIVLGVIFTGVSGILIGG